MIQSYILQMWIPRDIEDPLRRREVDFIVESGGRVELFEAKWTELPSESDTVNLQFVRDVMGKSRVRNGGIICRTRNSFPWHSGLHALPVAEVV